MSDYPATLDVRPLTTWPGQLTAAHKRERSPFSASLTSTLETLRRELGALHTRTPVLEVAIAEDQFRIDGRPRARAWAEHPGVVLSLPHTNVGALRYATDRFTTWQDNLRAIALGLEALRKVDRYGITRRGEQYQGFKALPPGATPMPSNGQMTVEDAARLLCEHTGQGVLVSHRDLLTGLGGGGNRRDDYLAVAWRSAAKRHHPDVGGDRDLWNRLEQAKRVLDQHGGAA